MSEAQYKKYKKLFPFLSEEKNIVLSSVFDQNILRHIASLNIKNKNEKWIILNSPSWIKGKDEA